MPAKRTISGETYEYQAVFVGAQMDTGAVKRVWVGVDGGLTDGVVLHHPATGTAAGGAVIAVFGLTEFRRFSANDLLAAVHYAAELRSRRSRDPNHNGSVVG